MVIFFLESINLLVHILKIKNNNSACIIVHIMLKQAMFQVTLRLSDYSEVKSNLKQ